MWRVRDRSTFAALARTRRVRRGPLTVAYVATPTTHPQIAFAIGRHSGGAVVRNRIRRRLRAAVAALGAELPPGAYLLRAGTEAATLPFTELQSCLAGAVRAATNPSRSPA